MTSPPRLSITELPACGGLIGIIPAPGRRSGGHRRDLDADIAAIAAWGAGAVVTLTEDHEIAEMGIARLAEAIRAHGMEWHHWPIPDFGTPDAAFDAAWPERSAILRRVLADGGRVLVHCKGGLGRSGLLAARLLADGGMTPPAAIAAVRAVRPGAIETTAQERWVGACTNPLNERPSNVPASSWSAKADHPRLAE